MDFGAPEILVILIVVLLIFGPGRIVRLSRELGTGIREFKQGLQGEPRPDDASTPVEQSQEKPD